MILVTAGCSAQSNTDSVATTSVVASPPTTTMESTTSLAGTTLPTPNSVVAVTTTAGSVAKTSFTLTSPDMVAGGAMPVAFTCDGQSQTPSLSWTSGPTGTMGYAIVMHHSPGPGDTHWYWVVYNIPLTTTKVAAGASAPGTLGTNSVNSQLAYAPPCSKGPGLKTYTYTAYALSATPSFTAGTKVSRDVLLAAISNITLASSSLDVTYDRS
jgi:phosphatidylethanolamine-binding protein (PEBP) family uncharacterized protein